MSEISNPNEDALNSFKKRNSNIIAHFKTLRTANMLFRFLTILSLSVAIILSCSDSKTENALNHADSLMETAPDSALAILSDMDRKDIHGRSQEARYALLMSKALDKNYIDTTSFDVLQPAIDYYIENGNTDEKLSTYYYQGRIFQNKRDRDKALSAFVKGSDLAESNHFTDTASLIRDYVAQAYIFYEYYDFEGYVQKNLKAANLSNLISNENYEFECLLNALNGSILLDNKSLADSIVNVCKRFTNLNHLQSQHFLEYQLGYALKFSSNKKVAEIIEGIIDNFGMDPTWKFNLALAYNKTGNNRIAKQLMEEVEKSGLDYDTLRYKAIMVNIYKDDGNYADALAAYEDFSRRADAMNNLKFKQKTKEIEEKHRYEISVLEDARRKSSIIWGCVAGIIILLMAVVTLCLLIRNSKSEKKLALEKVKMKAAEIVVLESEKLYLSNSNKNLQSEIHNKNLEANSLACHVESLENELEALKSTVDKEKGLREENREVIKMRIEILNAMLANRIADNNKCSQIFENRISELTGSPEKFMNFNRLTLLSSNPDFINYLELHGLTLDEINYVCLYAIGLNGKEVGDFLKKRGHVNMSSAIRKKLGIGPHDTNLGKYVRSILSNVND